MARYTPARMGELRTSGRTRPVAAAVTDVGRQRKHNEDHVLLRPEYGLFVVADGMGGHNAGNVASALASKSLDNYFEATQSGELPGPVPPDEAELDPEARRVVAGIRKANHDVFVISSTFSQHQGMGSTVVAALVSHSTGRIHIGHVGDSRCYRVRGGEMEQLTRDHSLINDALTLKPDLTPEELSRLPRNIITRALGMKEAVKVDIRSESVEPGDLFLLCSDGLSGMVSDDQILDVFEFTRDPQEACELLVAMANEAGGNDNISALIIRIDDATAPEVEPRPAARQQDETTQTYRIDDHGMLLPAESERAQSPGAQAAEPAQAAPEPRAEDAASTPGAASQPGQGSSPGSAPTEPQPSSAQPTDSSAATTGRHVAASSRGAQPSSRDTSSSRRRRHVEVRVARCQNCNHELFIGNNFCVECGAPIKL